MSVVVDIPALVEALVGVWAGEGDGGYRTIDEFAYREDLIIKSRPDHPALHFEQRTYKKTVTGEVVSHWETGLIRLSRDGTALMLNAQGGRVEALSGAVAEIDSGHWRIELDSTGFAGDDRVVSAHRTIDVTAERLTYEMRMTTRALGHEHIHLTATLGRVRESAIPGGEGLSALPRVDPGTEASPMEQPDSSVATAGSLRKSLGAAMVALEEVVSRATGLPDWRDQVETALEYLTQALRAHVNEVEAEGGLLDDIRSQAPRLAAEIEALIRDHERLMALCARIDNTLVISEGGEGGHVPSIRPHQLRHSITELLVELTLHRQRGSDLVYDAYNVDIAAGD